VAIELMKLMPPNLRGDFVYVRRDGSVLSNHPQLAGGVHFFVAGRKDVYGMKPDFVPGTDSSTGPYIREYAQTGNSAGAGFATVSCGNTTLLAGDTGNMYMGTFDSSGNNMDAGLTYDGGSLVSFVNLGTGSYSFIGWTNESQRYYCNQHVGVMFGVILYNNQQTGVLITGIPDEDPTTTQILPAMVHLNPIAWDFFQLPRSSFYNPGTWNGQPTPCQSCTAKRMTTIAFAAGHDYNNDTSCFGGCNGTATNFWDQVWMGNLSQPCNQTQGVSVTCTIYYFADNSWYGGLQKEPDSNTSASFTPAPNDPNQFQEGINLTPIFRSGQQHMVSTGHWHVYATPTPEPTSTPNRCGKICPQGPQTPPP
jgi:hypothetical protein